MSSNRAGDEVTEQYTDASVHALVGYGRHGKHEAIRDLRCQACGTKVSERRRTPFYRLKTPAWRVGEVMAFQRKAAHSQAEGLDRSAAERVFGYREETIRTWVARGGGHAARVHQHFLHHLVFSHIELDELRTTLRDKAHEL
jgi:hypothetical protein